jgi:hypothetical protein
MVAAITLALVASGCLSVRSPSALSPEGVVRPGEGRSSSVSLRLGPRALRVVLPLLLARSSPAAPLYVRHLDEVVVSVYRSDGPEAPRLSPAHGELVLRVRDETSTVMLIRPANSVPLDRFYLLVDQGDEQIVAYAKGDLVRLVRQAFASSF